MAPLRPIRADDLSQWLHFRVDFNGVNPFVSAGMAPKYCNNTAAAVKEMNAAGMSNVHFLDITASSVGANASYMGCAGHPYVHTA